MYAHHWTIWVMITAAIDVEWAMVDHFQWLYPRTGYCFNEKCYCRAMYALDGNVADTTNQPTKRTSLPLTSLKMIGFFHPLEDTTQYDYGCSFASTKHHSQVSRQWPGLTPLPTRVN